MKTWLKRLNEAYLRDDCLDEDNVSEENIKELAFLCQEPWTDELDMDLADDIINDDLPYHCGLDFRSEVLANALPDGCEFDETAFDYDLVNKIEDESEKIFCDSIVEFKREGLGKFHEINEYTDPNGGIKHVEEFVMPDEDEITLVARRDNRCASILTTDDFDYVEITVFYDDEDDVFYVVNRSYGPHPTMSCSVLGYWLEENQNEYKTNQGWDDIFDEDLLDEFING